MDISYKRLFFFFNDTATTEIYTLSLHDALPILTAMAPGTYIGAAHPVSGDGSKMDETLAKKAASDTASYARTLRSEEHTSELQSRQYLVCRLLLEKKKKIYYSIPHYFNTVPVAL